MKSLFFTNCTSL